MRPLRLRTVLLVSNLAVLALPVGGLWALRLYESALVRQTQSELVAQAAIVASVMRQAMHVRLEPRAEGAAVQPAAAAFHLARRHGLDLATDPILPPQPEPEPGLPADRDALEAGAALTPVLRDAQTVTLASLRVTDRKGVIVASSGADAGRSLAGWSEIKQVLEGAPVISTIHRREPAGVVPGGLSRTAGLRVFVSLPVTDGAGAVIGVVLASRTPNSVVQAVSGKWPSLVALSIALICGGAVLASLVSRLVTTPLGQVVAQARGLAAGAPIVPLGRPGTREVEALSLALARMAEILESRAAYIQGFAASVSHEFKTPMASIRAAAELLEDHAAGMSEAERRQLTGLVTEGVARLALLVRRLVELARADVMRAGVDAASVGADAVLERVVERFRGGGMDITLEGQAGGVRLPEEALDALVTSLLDNAAMHAPGAAVSVRAGRGDGMVSIIVADDGPGIAASHRGRAFEPFFTTARSGGGTGLGLPIVVAIATGAGGRWCWHRGGRGPPSW